MTVVYTPRPRRSAPRPPRWWQSMGWPEGTIFRTRDGVLWRKELDGDDYGTWVVWTRLDSTSEVEQLAEEIS